MEDIDIKMESKIMFKINDEKIENSIITILETITEIIFLMIMLFLLVYITLDLISGMHFLNIFIYNGGITNFIGLIINTIFSVLVSVVLYIMIRDLPFFKMELRE